MRHTAKPVVDTARRLLAAGQDDMDDVGLYQFDFSKGDAEAHDDARQDGLRREFIADCEAAIAELTAAFGPPHEIGDDDIDVVPLNGVFKFAVWELAGQKLYVAAVHEDRECPYLLMLGTAVGDVAWPEKGSEAI
jgi:hypothetical protein